MRTDHNSLADLIAAANAMQFERAAWWAMICRLAVCAVSAYIALAALAIAAEYFDLIAP